MSKLLPCPFCGSSKVDPEGWATLPEYAATPDERSGPACDDCGASAESATKWNTRATMPKGDPAAWMLERDQDPTFPRVYPRKGDALAMKNFINVGPLPTITPLYASPLPSREDWR